MGQSRTRRNGGLAKKKINNKFTGKSDEYYRMSFERAGIAKVSIDGKEIANVDQYGYTDVHENRLDQREVPFRWSVSDLGAGEHTVKI